MDDLPANATLVERRVVFAVVVTPSAVFSTQHAHGRVWQHGLKGWERKIFVNVMGTLFEVKRSVILVSLVDCVHKEVLDLYRSLSETTEHVPSRVHSIFYFSEKDVERLQIYLVFFSSIASK